MKFNCAYDEIVGIHTLVQNPKNANKHSKEQITRLAKIIDFQGQRSPIVVSKRSGFITKGHGRLFAMLELGWTKVAVNYQDYVSEAQEYADLIADNEIARWAELDKLKLETDLKDLDLGDIDLLGLQDDVLDSLAELEGEETEKYTTKIEPPIYRITGDKPSFEQVYDTQKTKELIQEIEQKNISKEVKEFLIEAAHRHTVFNYKHIAELYAHSTPDEQDLMEKSALVIIDFDKAIEYGFVKLTKEIIDIQSESDNE